jgi:hypothetical protein
MISISAVSVICAGVDQSLHKVGSVENVAVEAQRISFPAGIPSVHPFKGLGYGELILPPEGAVVIGVLLLLNTVDLNVVTPSFPGSPSETTVIVSKLKILPLLKYTPEAFA